LCIKLVNTKIKRSPLYVYPTARQQPDDVTILTNKSHNTKGAQFSHEEKEK